MTGTDPSLPDPLAEWLEADGSGGFASGTVSGVRTRRYHAMLLAATTPPIGRIVLVNGVLARCETGEGGYELHRQHYAPDVLAPETAAELIGFATHPWPCWRFRAGATVLVQELVVDRAAGETVLRWRREAGAGACRLTVRPLLSGRDYHALHRENGGFDFSARVQDGNVVWRPYSGLPAVAALTDGRYTHAPEWYRQFLYAAEQARGLDCIEDLAVPGAFAWDLASGPATMVLRAGDGATVRAASHAARILAAEASARPRSPALAAEPYLVGRGEGLTLVAGFPWFTDWGRDTFIALRGLLLATGRLDAALRILLAWSGEVSEGMLPNRFPDSGGAPEYNTVDAALWFVVAVDDLCRRHEAAARPLAPESSAPLFAAAEKILAGYAAGTRFGIAADADGLLRAGVPGMQLTWMDAKIGDEVVTPRIGKPVEVQALWINALRIAVRWSEAWAPLAGRATAAFRARFPAPGGGLFDVVDADHVAGRDDAALRPNQILAVGGLPFALLEGEAARAVVARVEAALLTPLGLRSLAPGEPGYVGRYQGGPSSRDHAYHQGTVWPWLIGPFVEAWLRVRGDTGAARQAAAARFLPPLEAHLGQAGLGHVSEVADGDAPHTPGGCPFQAWSLGEFLRVREMVGRDKAGPLAVHQSSA